MGDLTFLYTIISRCPYFLLPRVKSFKMSDGTTKSVLVTLLWHTRAMDLLEDEENLKQCVKQRFSDVLLLHLVADFFMQLNDASWGEFVGLGGTTNP